MTIVAAVTIAALIGLLGVVLVAANNVVAARSADRAADLGALAGANAIQEQLSASDRKAASGDSVSGDSANPNPEQACEVARRYVEKNGAELQHCEVDGEDVIVETTQRPGVVPRIGSGAGGGGVFTAHGKARAGP